MLGYYFHARLTISRRALHARGRGTRGPGKDKSVGRVAFAESRAVPIRGIKFRDLRPRDVIIPRSDLHRRVRSSVRPRVKADGGLCRRTGGYTKRVEVRASAVS